MIRSSYVCIMLVKPGVLEYNICYSDKEKRREIKQSDRKREFGCGFPLWRIILKNIKGALKL